jgi:hypothetical protein
MSTNDPFWAMDLTRVTWVGWALVLLSVAGAIAGGVLVGSQVDVNAPARPWQAAAAFLGVFAAGPAFFFLCKGALDWMGVPVLRPPHGSEFDSSRDGNSPIIAELRRRCDHTRRRAYFFALLVPCGCASLFFTVALLSREPKSTLGQVLALCGILELGVGLTGAFLLWRARGKYRHALAVAEQAERMGFLFTESPEEYQYESLRSLRVFRSAKSDSARHLIRGQANGTRVMALDYAICIAAAEDTNVVLKAMLALHSKGRARSVRTQTVVFLPRAAGGVPNFVLRPKTWAERVSRLLGDRLTGRPERSEFDKRYALRGGKGEGACLTPQVMELCLAGKGLTVEGFDGLLAVYRRNKVADAAEYPAMIATALRLAEALQARGRNSEGLPDQLCKDEDE